MTIQTEYTTHASFWISKDSKTMRPGDVVIIGEERHTMDEDGTLYHS